MLPGAFQMELEISSVFVFNAEGAGGEAAVARVAQTQRALKDLVLWHSVDREGKSFSCAKQRGRVGFSSQWC